MVKMAICEDEELFRNKLVILIEYYLEGKGLPYILDCYEKGEQLLQVKHEGYDILYLDVEIKNGMDGLTLAKKLREENNGGEIVFLTSHQEEAYKAFEVNAFRYLLKPLKKEILYQTMDLLIERIQSKKENNIVLQVGQNFIKLKLQDILHIETYKRKLRICTVHKEYMVDDGLGELEIQLKDRHFFRIHRSVLINLQYIKEHNNSTVTMQNGEIIPISRLKLVDFKQEFIRYLKGKKDGRIY